MLKGRSTVLTLETPDTPKGKTHNGLWWTNSFHAVAGVGFDWQNREIYMADPDSNRGSKEVNGGWTVPRVTANRYGALEAALAPPIANRTGNDAVPENYDLYYGTMRMNAAGDTIAASDANNGITPQGRYTGVSLTSIEAIAPQIAAIKGAAAAGNGFATSLALVGDVGGSVEEMLIYPVASIETSIVAQIDIAGWQAEYLSMGALDPWDTARPRGGVRFFLSAIGSGDLFHPFDTAEGVFGTQTEFSGFDVFVRYAGSDAWSFQSVGAPPNPQLFQTAVDAPEPNTLALLCSLLFGILAVRCRH